MSKFEEHTDEVPVRDLMGSAGQDVTSCQLNMSVWKLGIPQPGYLESKSCLVNGEMFGNTQSTVS